MIRPSRRSIRSRNADSPKGRPVRSCCRHTSSSAAASGSSRYRRQSATRSSKGATRTTPSSWPATWAGALDQGHRQGIRHNFARTGLSSPRPRNGRTRAQAIPDRRGNRPRERMSVGAGSHAGSRGARRPEPHLSPNGPCRQPAPVTPPRQPRPRIWYGVPEIPRNSRNSNRLFSCPVRPGRAPGGERSTPGTLICIMRAAPDVPDLDVPLTRMSPDVPLRRNKRRGGSGNRSSWPRLLCVLPFVVRPPTVST